MAYRAPRDPMSRECFDFSRRRSSETASVNRPWPLVGGISRNMTKDLRESRIPAPTPTARSPASVIDLAGGIPRIKGATRSVPGVTRRDSRESLPRPGDLSPLSRKEHRGSVRVGVACSRHSRAGGNPRETKSGGIFHTSGNPPAVIAAKEDERPSVGARIRHRPAYPNTDAHTRARGLMYSR